MTAGRGENRAACLGTDHARKAFLAREQGRVHVADAARHDPRQRYASRVEILRDPLVEAVAETHVQEHTERSEHDRHDDREHER